MSNFADMLAADVPRLVVKCHKNPNGEENFEWGMGGNGQMPILSLLGYLQRIEADMIAQLAERRNECPEMAFVVTWGTKAKTFDWWVHHDINIDSLVGMLGVVKLNLLMSLMQGAKIRPSAQAKKLLGPDGNPFNMR